MLEKVNVYSTDKNINSKLDLLKEELKINLDDTGVELIFIENQSQEVKIKNLVDKVQITAPNLPHFFNAVSRYVQMYMKNKIIDLEWNLSFEKNGFMIDSSRNAVLNVRTMKNLIKRMAVLGHTWLMLYIEDVYEIESEPYFGALRGRYTQNELRELAEFADDLGVELFPAIQTLAHINQFFYWEHEFRKYGDIDDVFNVGREETLTLIDKMLSTLSKSFISKRIHLGMDEAYNLGRGTFLTENGLKDKVDILNDHLEKLLKLTKQYDLQPIIWDDMFFSSYSNINNRKMELTNDVDLMYWDYYSTDENNYHKKIIQRSELSENVIFAGGAWKWTGYSPHHEKTLRTSIAALDACKKNNISQVIVTGWGDDGAEAPFETSYFGIVLYSYLNTVDTYDEAEFNEHLKFHTSYSYENWMRQGEFDLLPHFDKQKMIDVTPSKYFLYQDLLLPMFMDKITDLTVDYGEWMKELSVYFKDEVTDSVLTQYFKTLADHLAIKWDLPYRIWKEYHQGNKSALQKIAENEIDQLISSLEAFLQARRKIWLDENNPEGLEVLEYKLGGLLTRYRMTKIRLQEYLNGEVTSIHELEEKRLQPLPNEKDKEAVHYNRSLRMMTRSRMFY